MSIAWSDAPQGTTEWFAARAGCLTSSGADVVLGLAELRGDKGRDTAKGRAKYVRQRVAERLTGLSADSEFSTPAMEWGTAHEADARTAYAALTGHEVATVGFARREDMAAGTSLDGVVVGVNKLPFGAVEVKCPNSDTHLEYLDLCAEGTVPDDYVRQCVHHLWCVPTLEWIDFVTYDPRMPEHLQLGVCRLTREACHAMLERYEAAALRLLAQMDEEEARLRRKE